MPTLTAEDKKLLKRCLSDNPQLKAVFDRLAISMAPVLERMRESKGGIWVNNKDIQRQVNVLLKTFVDNLVLAIGVQTAWAWDLANSKNDALVNEFLKGIRLPAQVKAKYLNRNVEALKAFQTRKVDGLGFSDRVWRIRDNSQRLIETYLENGLSTGKSAAEISRDVRQFLQDPDALFRRIRNSKGQLVPSAPMKANRPGTGVYNSAYQNALRLAATETNMAYRNADYERWNQIDFVVGFEVITSDVHHTRMPEGDICDSLKGKYPKTFKFTGWHPRCFCQAIAIKLSREKFLQYLDMKANGDLVGANAIIEGASIKGVDAGVTTYVRDNSERFKGWKNEPYWLRDNFKMNSKGVFVSKTK
jgi:hypothetical protein